MDIHQYRSCNSRNQLPQNQKRLQVGEEQDKDQHPSAHAESPHYKNHSFYQNNAITDLGQKIIGS